MPVPKNLIVQTYLYSGHGHSHGGPPRHSRSSAASPLPDGRDSIPEVEGESVDELEGEEEPPRTSAESEKAPLVGGSRNGRAGGRGYGSTTGHCNDRASQNHESGSFDYSHAHARHHRQDGI